MGFAIRGVAQPGSAPGLGPGGRRFESCRPDKNGQSHHMIGRFVFIPTYMLGIDVAIFKAKEVEHTI